MDVGRFLDTLNHGLISVWAVDTAAGVAAPTFNTSAISFDLTVGTLATTAQGNSSAEPQAIGDFKSELGVVQVIPTPSHVLDRISAILSPFFPVFCAFSPSRRGGSTVSQAGTQGQETAAAAARSHLLGRISPIFSPFFPVFCALSPSR